MHLLSVKKIRIGLFFSINRMGRIGIKIQDPPVFCGENVCLYSSVNSLCSGRIWFPHFWGLLWAGGLKFWVKFVELCACGSARISFQFINKPSCTPESLHPFSRHKYEGSFVLTVSTLTLCSEEIVVRNLDLLNWIVQIWRNFFCIALVCTSLGVNFSFVCLTRINDKRRLEFSFVPNCDIQIHFQIRGKKNSPPGRRNSNTDFSTSLTEVKEKFALKLAALRWKLLKQNQPRKKNNLFW